VITVIGTSTVLAPERMSAVTFQVPMTETTVPCPTQTPSIPGELIPWWSICWVNRICETGRSGCVTDWNRRVTASALTGAPLS
jgi:hypothetical protein